LSKHLGSQALAKHKATLSVELDVLAKKFDRFGWERDRGTVAQDRMFMDWMDALKDFPLEEVADACRATVLANPNKMPNEGHIKAQILEARRQHTATHPKPVEPVAKKERLSDESEAERVKIMASFNKGKVSSA
jgi:hypothetical protein